MQIVDRDESLTYKHYSREWKWGFTPSAKIWNGRFARLGFVTTLLIEASSGEGIVDF